MFIKVKPLSSLAAGALPDSNTLYVDQSGALVTSAGAGAALASGAWEDGEYELDPQGRLVREVQKNTSTNELRTRVWTYATNAIGNEVATPGAWQ